MKHIVLFIFTIISLSTYTQQVNSQEIDSQQTSSLEADIAPAWQLKDEAGQTIKSADYAGKPLIIHFWATWCPYCKKLQPGLDRLYTQYKKDGLELISISIREDEGATPQSVLDARGLSLKTVVNGEKVAADFNVQGTPTTIFIDKKGNIIAQTQSSDPEDPRLEQVVKYLVAPP